MRKPPAFRSDRGASATSRIGALLLSSKLFLAVKWIGAAYLVIYGLRLIFSREEAVQELAIVDHKSHHLFFSGFTLQISNPKAILFFSALLPQFLNPHAPVVPQVVILGLTSAVIEFFILLFYGVAGSSLTPRYARWTNRVAGADQQSAGAGIATR